MPRTRRKQSRSGIYHVMLRGINRQTIFEDDEDRKKFLETLQKYKDICHYQLYSYCLMDNHVHLLLKESEETISKAIQRVSSSYVYWYNGKYERVGHLFQERFKSECVEERRYFFTVLRYIHQNPMRAGLVSGIWDYPWTSIHDYLLQNDPIVDTDYALQLLSEDRKTASSLLLEYMQQENDEKCLDDDVKIKWSDSDVREYLNDMGISDISKLQQLDRNDRNRMIMILKGIDGINIRQLSRITGVSKSVIHRL